MSIIFNPVIVSVILLCILCLRKVNVLLAIIISAILLMGHLSEPETIGPNLAVCFLAGFYAVIIEFFLLPLRLNAERKMNEEMDMEDE